MTIYVSQQEAEQQFSQLLSQVLKGEESVISVEGQEIARLMPSVSDKRVPSSQTTGIRVSGFDEGRFIVPDDFDDCLTHDFLINPIA